MGFGLTRCGLFGTRSSCVGVPTPSPEAPLPNVLPAVAPGSVAYLQLLVVLPGSLVPTGHSALFEDSRHPSHNPAYMDTGHLVLQNELTSGFGSGNRWISGSTVKGEVLTAPVLAIILCGGTLT